MATFIAPPAVICARLLGDVFVIGHKAIYTAQVLSLMICSSAPFTGQHIEFSLMLHAVNAFMKRAYSLHTRYSSTQEYRQL